MVAAILVGLIAGGFAPLDIDGHIVNLSGAKATVAFVVIYDCPVARQFSPEMNKIAAEYTRRGAKFILIQARAETSVTQARTHRQEFGFKMPVVIDRSGALVKIAKAVAVPTAAIFNFKGQLVYSGRIDDRYAKLGVLRSKPTRHDLRDALDQVLSGKRVKNPLTIVVGCLL